MYKNKHGQHKLSFPYLLSSSTVRLPKLAFPATTYLSWRILSPLIVCINCFTFYGCLCSDLLDRHRFASALMSALPKLEKGSSSLTLASSDVLRQRKVKLLDSRLRGHMHKEAFPQSKQVGGAELHSDLHRGMVSQKQALYCCIYCCLYVYCLLW